MPRRILIVSEDLVEPWDEGIKKFSVSVARVLASDHSVSVINVDRSGLAAARNGAGAVTRNGSGDAGDALAICSVPGTRTFMSPSLRRAVATSQPDAIIYVPSPSSTAGSFVRAFALRRHWPHAKVGMVALIPRRHGGSRRIVLQGTAPDCLFVPSYASLLHARDFALRSELLPVGVDLATFRLPLDGERAALRRAYGIDETKFVFLHVGHLSEKRNVGALARLAALPNTSVIVIGSTSTPEDAAVRRRLEDAGVRVIREFVPVHEFYRMADAYVFPTIDVEGCVEIPLSVLEALASGLPVIARPFGGLRDVLPAGDDVRYFDDDAHMLAAAESLRAGPRPRTRDLKSYSWRAVAERIVSTLLSPPGVNAS